MRHRSQTAILSAALAVAIYAVATGGGPLVVGTTSASREGMISGLTLSTSASTGDTWEVTPGAAADSTGIVDLVVTGTLSGDLSDSGANGLDTGSGAAATIYHVYVIFGTSGYATMASLSATSPTMPSGYTYFRRVGALVTVAASANFIDCGYSGAGLSRWCRFYQESGDNNTRVVSSLSGTNWTAVDCSGIVPATATDVEVRATNSNGGHLTNVAPGSSNGTGTDNNYREIRLGLVQGANIPQEILVLQVNATPGIRYKVSNAVTNATIDITAFRDDLTP